MIKTIYFFRAGTEKLSVSLFAILNTIIKNQPFFNMTHKFLNNICEDQWKYC